MCVVLPIPQSSFSQKVVTSEYWSPVSRASITSEGLSDTMPSFQTCGQCQLYEHVSMWSVWCPSDLHDIHVICMMSVWSLWCPCDLHDVRVTCMMSVWSLWYPCDLHDVHVICMLSVWSTWCLCYLYDVLVICMVRYCVNVLHARLRVLLLSWNAKELGPKGVTFSCSLSWACDAILVHMAQGSFTHRHTHTGRPFPLQYTSSGATVAILSQKSKCAKTCISMMLLNGMKGALGFLSCGF